MSALENVNEIAKGIISGTTIGLLQGLGETGALLTDFAFDTNNARDVTNFFEDLKYKLNLDPNTPAGEIAETITPFLLAGIPVVGWASIASKAAQGAKVAQAGTFFGKTAQNFGRSNAGKVLLGGDGLLNNIKRTGFVTGGTAFADFMVAPSTNQTLVDSFDALGDIAPIFQTQGDDGLVGRQDALRRFQNKLKIGVEGGVLGGAIGVGLDVAPTTVGLLGTGIGQTRRAIANVPLPPGSSQEARTIGSVISSGFQDLTDGLSEVPAIQAVGNTTNFLFRSSGNLEKSIFERIKDAGSTIDADIKMSVTNFAEYDRAARAAVGGFFKSRAPKGKDAYEKAYSDLLEFLNGTTKALDSYPVEMKNIAQKLADRRNAFSQTIFTQIKKARDKNLIDEQSYKILQEAFEKNEGAYLRTIYEGGFNSDKSVASLLRSPKYNNALKEIRAAFNKIEPEKYRNNTEKLNMDSESFLKRMLLKDRFENNSRIIDPGISVKAQDPSRIALIGSKEGVQEVDSARIPLLKISEGLLQSRNAILENSPLTRELMGEVKNGKEAVAARYMQTIIDMSTLSNANKLFDDFLNNPNITKTTIDHIRDVKNGDPSRPLILDGGTDGLTRDDQFLLKQLGYETLPSNPNSVFGGQYGDLSGKIVAKELVSALSIKPINTITLGPFNIGTAWALGLRAKSASQIAQTVFSPTSQVRNFIGGPFFLLANGHVPRGGDIIDSIDLTMTKLSKMSDDEYARRQDFMVRSGLSESSAVINEVRDTLKGRRISGDVNTSGSVTGFTKDQLDKMIPETLKTAGKATGTAASRSVGKLFDIYSGVDTLYKQAAFTAEKARIAAAVRKSIIAGSNNAKASIDDLDFNTIADDLVDQGIALRATNLDGDNFLDVMSADIVKASMPMYDRVPRAFAFFRDLPIIANFVSFASEIFRNSRNIIQQGANELAFNSTPQIQAKLGTRIAEKIFDDIRLAPDGFIQEAGRKAGEQLQREINAIGLQRLTGYTTSAFIATPTIGAATAGLLGVSQSVLDALDREKPYFYKGHTLVPLSKPEDGKIKYTTLSYFSPYETIAAIPKSFIEEYSKQGRLGKDKAEQVTAGVLNAAGSLIQPFTEEALLAERLIDVTARKGRTPEGGFIYQPEDDFDEKFAKSFGHVLQAVTPRVIRDFVEVEQINPLTGTFVSEPQRVTLAIEQARENDIDVRGKTDRVFKPGEEVLRYAFGLTTMEMDFKDNLAFNVYDYNSARNSSINAELRNKFRTANLTQEKLIDAVKDSVEELFPVQQKMYLALQDAKAGGGLDDEDIQDLVLSNPQRAGATLAGGANDFYLISENNFAPLSLSNEDKQAARLEEKDIEYVYDFDDRISDLIDIEDAVFDTLQQIPLDQKFPQDLVDGLFNNVKRRFGILPPLEREEIDVPVLSQRPSSPNVSNVAPQRAATQAQSFFNPGSVDQLDIQTLLGDNPREQSKNVELFNRLNRNK